MRTRLIRLAVLIVALVTLGIMVTPAYAARAQGAIPSVVAASPSPSTSPSVHHCNGSDPNWGNCIKCPAGYACAFVQANGYNNVFWFLHGTYKLYNWHGTENLLINNQTGGWMVRTYDQNGYLLHCYGQRQDYNNVDWNPVWSVVLSPGPCPSA